MLTNIVAFLFVLGVLIFVHELGHFWMARRVGVRVLTFSLGFGPKLFRVVRNDTEYCISAIPLGGYVKMAGESAEDDARTGAPDEFLSRTKWERFQILVMGPVMNVALAIVVTAGVLYTGAEVPAYEDEPPVVGVLEEGSVAAAAGVEIGDRILSVAGRPVETWEDYFIEVSPRAGQRIQLDVLRGGATVSFTVTPEATTRFSVGDLGLLPATSPQIRVVTPGRPADRAGLQVDDVILAVDGRPVDQESLIAAINASTDVPLTLTIRRAGEVREVSVTPQREGDVGLIGVRLSGYEVKVIQPGPLEAIRMSVTTNLEMSARIFQTLAGLLTGSTPAQQLMGPVGIGQLAGGAAEAGWKPLFSLLAMISLNLGLLNLLPIPILDGGHIFIMAVEGMFRRDFSVQVKEKMLLAGFLVLMVLMVTVIYNDLTRIAWVERFMPWR